MDISRVQRGERIAIYGGILLIISVFLPWYGVNISSDELGTGDISAWDAHPTLRWLLIAAAVAPLILAWIIANDHKLSWPRGQVTMVVAIAAFGFIAYNGVIDRPGPSNSFISLQYGWFLAIVASLLMLTGSLVRQGETELKRKPPGTI